MEKIDFPISLFRQNSPDKRYDAGSEPESTRESDKNRKALCIGLMLVAFMIMTAYSGDGGTLRSSYQTLSNDEVESMFEKWGFFDRGYNPSGNFQNNYALKTVNGDQVVVDRATGLMWHQSGSDKSMIFSDAESWVRDLNRRGYAGYSDWRLPTLEEAASLLESSKMNGDLYIDSVFSRTQRWIWTGDKFDADRGWVVGFNHGRVNWDSHYNLNRYYFVRPVRRDR